MIASNFVYIWSDL